MAKHTSPFKVSIVFLLVALWAQVLTPTILGDPMFAYLNNYTSMATIQLVIVLPFSGAALLFLVAAIIECR